MQADKRFRENLRAEMDRRGVSQRELAKKAKAGYPGLNRVLQGKQAPTIDFADRLADALGISLSDLISSTGK